MVQSTKSRGVKADSERENHSTTERCKLRRGPSIRQRSRKNFWGWPVFEIAVGPDLDRGEADGHARAWVAIGDRATGFVAIGGLAQGIFAAGGLSIGLVTLGGCTLGLVGSLGGVAAGAFAMGGVAMGWAVHGGAEVPIQDLWN